MEVTNKPDSILFAARTSEGPTTEGFFARYYSPGEVSVASSDHTHDFTTGAPGGTTPTTDVAYDLHACYVASSDHTHSFSGTTGSASPGTSSVNLAHTHSIGAPSTATFVSAVGILPEDWITVVTGDAPVAEVEFDWLAILP